MPFTPSDVVLLISGVLALVFSLDYGVGSPWYRHPLGWTLFLYSLATVALFTLVIFAIVFEKQVPEGARLGIAIGIALALSAKIGILEWERHLGRKERRRSRVE